MDNPLKRSKVVPEATVFNLTKLSQSYLGIGIHCGDTRVFPVPRNARGVGLETAKLKSFPELED
jgi:hypothetical protein